MEQEDSDSKKRLDEYLALQIKVNQKILELLEQQKTSKNINPEDKEQLKSENIVDKNDNQKLAVVETYISAWNKCLTFTGVSNRKEYFTFRIVSFCLLYLFLIIIAFVQETASETLIGVVSLGVIFCWFCAWVMSISLTVRRLRDAGFGWGWMFLPIVAVVMCFLPTSKKNLKYTNGEIVSTIFAAIIFLFFFVVICFVFQNWFAKIYFLLFFVYSFFQLIENQENGENMLAPIIVFGCIGGICYLVFENLPVSLAVFLILIELWSEAISGENP
jgi:uncharacterized membrane protein YhaH (DUF805 family)